MKAYWRNCGYRYGNFGDELTPHIIKSIIGEMPDKAETMKDADIISIGSILNEIDSGYNGIIWGTGCMFHHSKGSFNSANIKAVRGKLSASRYNINTDVFGDPALLIDRIASKSPKYDLAIVPHYVDYNNLWVRGFLNNNKVKIIDPCQPVLDCLQEISQSRYLLSSALHPLICADSLGIPNGWIYLSDSLSGGDFKFRDYYSVFNINDILPIPFDEHSNADNLIDLLQEYSRPNIDSIKESLLKSFPT